MQSNKSCGTKPELRLGRALWKVGVRYRKNVRSICGSPDFAIKKYKIAIFCDGEFWHGRDWQTNKYRIKSNRDFWFAKIERNIKRDIEVTKQLEAEGWKVFRFWESDVKKDSEACARKVAEYMSTLNER